MNFVFITDKAEAYTAFERDNVLKTWGVERSDTRTVTSLEEVGVASLFGGAPVSILKLDLESQVQELGEKLKSATPADAERFSNPGLVIVTNVARTYSKTVEKFVKELGGEVMLSKSSNAKETPIEKILDGLKITREAKNFLRDYAGDDYSSLLGVVKTLGELSPKQQAQVTVDALLVHIPTPPGGVPPWEIEKPLMAGDVGKTIELYRRFIQTSNLLVILSVVKNKVRLMLRVAALLEENPKLTPAAIAASLSPAEASSSAPKDRKDRVKKSTVANNYPLKLAVDSAKRVGYDRALAMMEILNSTEQKIKSGTAGDLHVRMESTLIQLALLAKR